jgi:hypothetical protein
MAKDIGVFLSNGAFGDQSWAFCQIDDLCKYFNEPSVTVHTSRSFYYTHGDQEKYITPPSADVLQLWSMNKQIKSIVFDIVDKNSLQSAVKKHEWFTNLLTKGFKPYEYHDLKENLIFTSKYTKISDKPLAVFQPVSLAKKPKDKLDSYIQPWNETLNAVINKGFDIAVIGTESEKIDFSKTFYPKFDKYLIDLVGKTTLNQALEIIVNQSSLVLSCDSWSGVFGISCRKPTCMSFGYRLQNNIDSFLMDYLGNKDVYIQQNASDKEMADYNFAEWIKNNF